MKIDMAGDPDLNLFQVLLDEAFANEEYEVDVPLFEYWLEFPDFERHHWRPNNGDIFVMYCDAKWFMGTWKDYIRPKYKRALDRWNKETGGGDGKAVNFINYCASD